MPFPASGDCLVSNEITDVRGVEAVIRPRQVSTGATSIRRMDRCRVDAGPGPLPGRITSDRIR